MRPLCYIQAKVGREGKGKEELKVPRLSLILISILVLLASCAGDDSPAAKAGAAEAPDLPIAAPDTLEGRFSYVLGHQLGATLEAGLPDVDVAVVAQGLMDYIAGTGLYSEEEMVQILSEYQDRIYERAEELYLEMLSGNLEAAEAFLSSNASRSEVVSISDGVQYEVLQEASPEGQRAGADSLVTVDYQCIDLDGNVVDSTYSTAPAQLSLVDTIPGFRAVVSQMAEGERVRAWVHPSQAYGAYGSGNIAPNELLIFDIELVSVDG